MKKNNRKASNTRIVAVIALLFGVIVSATAQSAMMEGRITIANGDSAVVTPMYPSPSLSEKEIAIGQKYADELLSSGLLRMMDIQDYEEDIRKMVQGNCYGLYNDVRIRKEYNCFEILKGLTWDLDSYIRKMLKIKKVREYVMSVVTRAMVDFCTYYPKDFKTNVVASLENIQLFMDQMPSHSFELVNRGDGLLDLYVDGRLNEKIPGTIRGFILRRILVDEVPADEIKGYVASMLKALRGAKNSSNPDVFYKISINDEINYFLTSTESYFQSKKSGVKVIPYEDPCNWQIFVQGVYVIKDEKETYYKIRNGVYGSDRVWIPDVPWAEPNEILMDSKCEVIYTR